MYCGLVAAMVLAVLADVAFVANTKFLGVVLLIVPGLVGRSVHTALLLILYYRVLCQRWRAGSRCWLRSGWSGLGSRIQQLRGDARRMAVAMAIAIVLALGVGLAVSFKQAALTEKDREDWR